MNDKAPVSALFASVRRDGHTRAIVRLGHHSWISHGKTRRGRMLLPQTVPQLREIPRRSVVVAVSRAPLAYAVGSTVWAQVRQGVYRRQPTPVLGDEYGLDICG